MLLLPNPKRLMLGYLLGAYTTSITLGLLIVFSLNGSSTESTSKHKVSPLEDIVVGLLLLVIAWVLRTGRDQPFQERRRRKKEAKLAAKREAGKPTESLPLRLLGKGDPKVTFVVGAVSELPRRLLPRRVGPHPQAQPGNRPDRSAGPVLLFHAADLHRGAAARLRVRAREHRRTGSPGSEPGWVAAVAPPP